MSRLCFLCVCIWSFVVVGCGPSVGDAVMEEKPSGGAKRQVDERGSQRVRVEKRVDLDDLKFEGLESRRWVVLFGFEFQGKWVPKAEYQGGVKQRVSFQEPLSPGDLFFTDGPLKLRFKFLGFEERPVENPRLGVVEVLKFARFEDMDPKKRGRVYEVPNRLPRARLDEYAHHDEEVTLRWEPERGVAKSFALSEGDWFRLPGVASSPAYRLKKVTGRSVSVEWLEEGKTHVRLIQVEHPRAEPAATIRELIGD
ncbi:hypothetical protein JIN81_17185 [Haloferula rosea]|uniref:DUF3108 domain-containing protein n=2 Tax=Haloferula rosea TaxID=490093 RepID=A0A934RCS0_9BACT|nr:hypothetical protein [Haloferula rosea]